MAYLSWNDSLELGHPIIDPDHQGLVEAINRLARLIGPEAGDGLAEDERRKQVAAASQALREATEKHFQSEAWIMETAAYPALKAHQNQHQQLLAEYDAFAADFLHPAGGNAEPALNFLRDWFLYHMQTWDQSFVSWLAERPEP